LRLSGRIDSVRLSWIMGHFMPRVALVVDDSMLIRHTVCRFLEEHGYEVDTATNGLEALQVLTHRLPDFIVTDLQMPKMSGPELITALKQRVETRSIPVVVVSGRESGVNGREIRADYCINKDIDIGSQLEKALKALNQSATANPHRAQN
jgi:CheY-like chemotaxis protein